MKKGLIIEVYRSTGIDCSNNGISEMFDNLTLIGDGIEGPFEPNEERPAVTVAYIRNHPFLTACDSEGKPLPGHKMFGGNFAYTSDSRFPSDFPLGIHDRIE